VSEAVLRLASTDSIPEFPGGFGLGISGDTERGRQRARL